MTTETLYYQAKLKLNRLGTGIGVTLDPAIFINLFNAAQTAWWKKALAIRSDSIFRDQLESLLVTDQIYRPYSQEDRHYKIQLPVESYQITGVLVKASKENCSRSFTADPLPSQVVNELWMNPLSRPDFGWEQTFYTISQGSLLVYYKEFEVDSVLMSYYQTPPDIDIAGYIHLNEKPSQTINSPLPDELLQEVLMDLIASLQ